MLTTVAIETHDGTVEKLAQVHGPLALHPAVERQPYEWAITHVASGRAVLFVRGREAARNALRKLQDSGIDWSQPAESDYWRDNEGRAKALLGTLREKWCWACEAGLPLVEYPAMPGHVPWHLGGYRCDRHAPKTESEGEW